MSVEIDPLELGFHRPFTVEVSQILKIKNPNHVPIAFKVKTTAPKQYCVRPNSGRIEPGKEVEVTVALQAMKQEPPLDAKCRDKFLVQSVPLTADKDFTDMGSIWHHVDNADKASVQEKKIRVVFLPAHSFAASITPQRNGVNGYPSVDDTAPPAYRSPSPPEEAFTPQTRSNPVGPVSTLDSEPARNKHLIDAKASATNSTIPSSVKDSITNAAAAISNAVPASYEDLKAQLTEAQATISAYGQEGGLRMRKAAGTSADKTAVSADSIRQQAAEGVPVQLVAVLCLTSFLLAYLFF